MSIEDLVQEMFLVEAFVDDVQKFSTQVSFNLGVPWGVVPYNVSLSASCC